MVSSPELLGRGPAISCSLGDSDHCFESATAYNAEVDCNVIYCAHARLAEQAAHQGRGFRGQRVSGAAPIPACSAR